LKFAFNNGKLESIDDTIFTMSIKETFKDIGRHIIGEGEEVKFKNEVASYEKRHGVSHEQAIKDLLFDRSESVQLELNSNGIVGAQSKSFKEFGGALREIFGQEKLKDFCEDAVNPGIFRNPLVSSSTRLEVGRVQGYFSAKFKNQTPALSVVKDCADNMKLMNALLKRFSNDPRLRGTSSLEDVINSYPELGADLGKIFETRSMVENHERSFKKDLNFEKAVAEFKETAGDSFNEMFWKAPFDCLTNIVKKGFKSKGLGGFVGAVFSEAGRFAGREMWAGTKLLAGLTYTAGSLVKNKVF
jgi:hypothetical protein